MRRNREAGQALVAIAVALVVLLLAAGLGIDMGYLRYEKRLAQTAADSAAIAGAAESEYGDQDAIDSAAWTDATSNGFSYLSNGVTVTPTSLTCADGTALCVQVVVSRQVPTFFMRIAGANFSNVTVSASATAKLGSAPECMYAGSGGLNLSLSPGISPGSMVTANNCGVLDNGPTAICDASSHLQASFIGETNTVGAGGACASGAGTGTTTPTPLQTVPSADPLAYLVPPASAFPQCSQTTPSLTVSNNTVTIPAGDYPCGIQITGNATVTFQPGLYRLGSISGNTANSSPLVSPSGCSASPINTCTALFITGPSNLVTGNGVAFYNKTGSIALCVAERTAQSNDATDCSFGNRDFSNDPPPNLSLTASTPTNLTNQYPDVLFYQDPGNSAPAIISGADDGNSTATFIEGALYFPDATLNIFDISNGSISGTAWQNTYTILDAKTIDLYGTINLGSAYPNGNSPIKAAVLVK